MKEAKNNKDKKVVIVTRVKIASLPGVQRARGKLAGERLFQRVILSIRRTETVKRQLNLVLRKPF